MIRRHLRRWPPVAERARVAAQLIAEAAAFTDDIGVRPGTLALAAASGSSGRAATVPVTSSPAPAPSLPPVPAPAPPPAPAPSTSVQAQPFVDAGVALTKRGLWTQAAPQFRRALELDPTAIAIWCRLGEALNHMDDLAGARAAFERAIEIDPLARRALYGLGVVFDRLRRPEEATSFYRRAREPAAQ